MNPVCGEFDRSPLLVWERANLVVNRRFTEIHEELRNISSKGLLSRINSSAGNKEKIQDCVVRTDQLVSSIQLQLHVVAHERLEQIHSDVLVSAF